jgi:diadenylate cyclase
VLYLGKDYSMSNFITVIKSSILQFQIKDIIDIFLVAILIYGLIRMTSKTRAVQVLKGLGVFLIFAQICELIGLTAMTWILEWLIGVGAILIVVLFQPELRRALERVGRGRLFDISFSSEPSSSYHEEAIEEIHKAVLNLSIHMTGALIVIEKKTGLRDVIESGTVLDANVTSQLIENVFFPNAPMHDGAMIIKGSKVVAAGCFLPLSDNKHISVELGTRHRAALGISEISDASVIIVSEESGVISLAKEGTFTRYLDSKSLRTALEDMFGASSNGKRIARRKLKWKVGKS